MIKVKKMESHTVFEVIVSHKGIEKKNEGLRRKTLKSAQEYRDEVRAKGDGWDAEILEYEIVPVFKKKH